MGRDSETQLQVDKKCASITYRLNQFKPEFTFAIFIHYKPRIALRISRLIVDEDDLKWLRNEKKIVFLLKDFHENFRSKGFKKI